MQYRKFDTDSQIEIIKCGYYPWLGGGYGLNWGRPDDAVPSFILQGYILPPDFADLEKFVPFDDNDSKDDKKIDKDLLKLDDVIQLVSTNVEQAYQNPLFRDELVTKLKEKKDLVKLIMTNEVLTSEEEKVLRKLQVEINLLEVTLRLDVGSSGIYKSPYPGDSYQTDNKILFLKYMHEVWNLTVTDPMKKIYE